jgi:RHS repeat-associated protein
MPGPPLGVFKGGVVYHPFGLTFNSYQRENSLAQDYKYNGKEEQTELNLGWLDYGARMYQPDLGRFFTQDRFATKYFGISSYSYVDNNPLLYVDVNGDSINVSNLISKNGKVSQEGLYVLFNMISDLQDIRGMSLSVNGNGKIISDGKGGTTGSKKARDYVSALISDKDDILVKNDNTKDTQGGGRGSVNINSTLIDNNIASANNAGLGELTFGYGMSFLHETVHTAIGTKIINPTATSTIKDNVSTTYPAGPTVAKVNEFRNELGLPERAQYYWTTPSLSVAPTMTWNKAGTPVTMTMTPMSTYDKMTRRMRATALKKKKLAMNRMFLFACLFLSSCLLCTAQKEFEKARRCLVDELKLQESIVSTESVPFNLSTVSESIIRKEYLRDYTIFKELDDAERRLERRANDSLDVLENTLNKQYMKGCRRAFSKSYRNIENPQFVIFFSCYQNNQLYAEVLPYHGTTNATTMRRTDVHLHIQVATELNAAQTGVAKVQIKT